MTSHILRLGIAGAVLLSLAACGGSGGSGDIDPDNQAPVISGFSPASPFSIQVRQENVMVSVLASDPENDPLTFAWQQVSGPVVLLRNTTSDTVTFNGPPEDGAGQTIVLRVTVSDENQDSSLTVTINVAELEFNEPPVVDAADDQSVNAGDPVVLTATASDPDDGDTLSFGWTQIDGEPVVDLTNADQLTATFTAPNVTERRVLTFRITVTDSADPPNQASDQTVVTIQPLPRPAGPTNLYVSLNAPATENEIHKLIEQSAGAMNYVFEKRFISLDNEGLALDLGGNAVHIGDDDDDVDDGTFGNQDRTGGVSFLCKLGRRAPGAAFTDQSDGVRDRDIRGVATLSGGTDNASGLNRQPGAKGNTIAHERGRVIVANFAGQNVKVFGSSVEGNIGAIATVSLGARPWDVAYDEDRDILYVAATNGTIRILDDFLGSIEDGGSALETRTARIVDQAGSVIATNLHGIAYEPVGDRLVITDVGAVNDGESATFAEDGAIYVFASASALSGDEVPQFILEGAATGLGNPVDVVINGRDALVAEKANNEVLLFRDIFTNGTTDRAPDRRIAIEGPESLALEILNPPDRFSVTDLRDPASVSAIFLSVDGESGQRVARLAPALGEDAITGLLVASGQPDTYGLVLDVNGDGFILHESPTPPLEPNSGGVTVLNRIQDRFTAFDPAGPTPEDAFRATRDRRFSAAGSPDNPRLQSPRGIDIIEDQGLLLVSDANPNTESGNVAEIEIFSVCGNGGRFDQVSIFQLTNPNADTPWGLDYDPVSGDLYLAMENGYIAVYRNFDVRFPDNPDPSFILRPQQVDPVTGAQSDVTSNLRGIEYDSVTDTLIVSDIGSEGDDADGKLVLIRNVSTASATEIADVVIEGADTLLGDPIDIALDGENLYIADSARQVVTRFDNIFTKSSGNIAPDAFTLTGELNGTPRGLIAVPDYLGERPRQRAE